MQCDPRAYLSDVLEAAAAIQEATSTIGEALKLISQQDPLLVGLGGDGTSELLTLNHFALGIEQQIQR